NRRGRVGAVLGSGLLSVVGAMIPTEVVAVAALGDSVMVKLFPASLGGPSYLKALRGPFPELRVIPTGGFAAHNLADWAGAGAHAVGVGSEVCPPAAVEAGDTDALRLGAADFADAVQLMRSPGSSRLDPR